MIKILAFLKAVKNVITNHKKITILTTVIIVILIFLGCVAIKGISDIKIMKQNALVSEQQFKLTINYMKSNDFDNASVSMDKAEESIMTIKNKLNEPLWETVGIIPAIKSVGELVNIMNDASSDVIRPTITHFKKYPLTDLKAKDGVNVGLLMQDVEFADELVPKIDNLISRFDNINISKNTLDMIDKSGKLNEYKNKFASIENKYKDIKRYMPITKTILGNGNNRLYILAAQNSSEIRSCGGFPGSVGTIRIKDGILTIGDFKSVYDILPPSVPASAGVTPSENKLFGNNLSYPRDAEYSPDFERVGKIWASSYEAKHKEHIDGVISLTPSVIQKILQTCGNITLSDGTMLDGCNATKVLQYNIYNKYFSKATNVENSNKITDALFAETAKKTMDLFTSKFDVKNAKDSFSIFSDGTKDRTILLWMADKKEENIIKENGCSGALNTGSPNAVAGVYYSGSDPCKLGWYFDLNTQIGQPVINKDGTRTYKVKVILNNVLDKKTISKAGKYILGNYNGAMKGYVYLVAPVGGNIDNFNTNNNTKIKTTEYQGVKLGYSLNITIKPNTPVEITYEVTTAAGVSDPLKVSSTPTLEAYR